MAYIASFSPDGGNVRHQSVGKSTAGNETTDSFKAVQIKANGAGLVAGETESYSTPDESSLWLISF